MKTLEKKHYTFKPKHWTKHHTHRIVHISGFVVALTAVVVSGWVFGNNLNKINADTTKNIAVGLTIPGITPGPTSTGSTGGSIPISQPFIKGQAYVTISPKNSPDNKFSEITVNRESKNQAEFVFNSPNPQFVGQTNIKEAKIHVEVHGSQVISSNFNAGFDGNFEWTPPVPLSTGEHFITVSATDPHYSGFSVSNKIYILIQTPPSKTGLPQPQSGYEQTAYPQATLTIVNNPKVVIPGQEILVKVHFSNFDLQGHDQNTRVSYIITDPNGNNILDSSEIMSLGKNNDILKSFYTNPGIDPGVYNFTLNVDANGAIITANDSFSVSKVITSPGTIQSNNSMLYPLLVIGLGLLILILLIILLWEYNKVRVLSWRIKQLSSAK